jgi:hypothetical protein
MCEIKAVDSKYFENRKKKELPEFKPYIVNLINSSFLNLLRN